MSYAEGTKVSIDKSQSEIMSLLAKFGITKRAMMSDESSESVGFEFSGIAYRISILVPDINQRVFTHDGRNMLRSNQAKEAAWDQENRRRWRSLCLVMKAKLVAIEDKITTFEQEFLAYAVTDNGQVLGDRIIPSLKAGGPLALGGRK